MLLKEPVAREAFGWNYKAIPLLWTPECWAISR